VKLNEGRFSDPRSPKAQVVVADLQKGESAMSLADAVGYFRRCGRRRGVFEAIIIDYDRTIHREKA
jgi:hypothetical protein